MGQFLCLHLLMASAVQLVDRRVADRAQRGSAVVTAVSWAWKGRPSSWKSPSLVGFPESP